MKWAQAHPPPPLLAESGVLTDQGHDVGRPTYPIDGGSGVDAPRMARIRVLHVLDLTARVADVGPAHRYCPQLTCDRRLVRITPVFAS